MNKKLTLLIFLFPMLAFGQVQIQNGGLIFDFGNKKDKQQRDSIEKANQIPDAGDDLITDKPKREKKPPPPPKPVEPPYDYRKDGLFRPFVHAGLTACQIDGDSYAGYDYLGADAGVGTFIRFHKNFSVSFELNYTMKGARQEFQFMQVPVSQQRYHTVLDYVEVPVGVNIYGKNLVVFSVGLSVAALVYYQQFDEDDDNVTSNPPEGSQPHKVDFCGWASLDFIIHKNFMIGGKFSYSLIKFRGPRLPGISAVNGEYNNDLSLRLSYIIPTVKKSKKVMSN